MLIPEPSLRPGVGVATTDADVFPERVRVIDSHTEGEPTRVVLDGWPQPPGSTMAERRAHVCRYHDDLRRAVVCEPRGHAAVVGALITPPERADSAAGVVFFNNIGCLNMCGHGLIGVVRTLAQLGRLEPGTIHIDTPAGATSAELNTDGSVTIRNVPAYCHALDVAVDVPGVGRVVGDIAWGGNWFFITTLPGPIIEPDSVSALLGVTRRILAALREQGVRGRGGEEIDHVELTGPPVGADADARNFVLCPGGEYDRSPCGTGTSAKMAVLHARGRLEPGQEWRQESVTGGRFTGWLEVEHGELIPFIRGRAFITSESTLLFDPCDPLRAGFNAA